MTVIAISTNKLNFRCKNSKIKTIFLLQQMNFVIIIHLDEYVKISKQQKKSRSKVVLLMK